MTLKRFCTAIVLPALMLLLSQASFAQEKTVTGKVTNSKDGSPVAGVSVTAKGSTTGTQTGADGTYSLSVPASANTLVFTAVGFGRQEVRISGATADVAMVSTATDLSEVVVTGYGTTRKKDLTGSVAQVKAKDFNQGAITAPDQLIQGKVAGVQVINNTGAPGGATTVRIRGISSLRSGNTPLYVVDGVPLSGGSAIPGLGTSLGTAPSDNPLNFINPNDIATIDVLKDASATAIYGSRGANGVIIITTKRGRTGAPRLEANASVGYSNLLKQIEVLDGNEYREQLQKYNLGTSGDFGKNTDALDAILRTALVQNYNVAMSGGNETGRYRLSAGYMNQQGIVKESGFQKFTVGLNSTFKFLESKKLGVDLNAITSNTKTESAPISNDAGFQGSLIGTALQWNPTMGLDWSTDDPDGPDIPGINGSTMNPLALLAAYDDINNATSILASISPYYEIIKGLEYRFLYSINYSTAERRTEIRNWLNQQGIQGRGFGQIANNHYVNQQLTHTLTWNRDFGTNFHLNLIGGFEYLKYDYKGSGMQGNNFEDYPGLKYTDYMQIVPRADLNVYSVADPISELQSYFARGTLNFADRILVTATVRRDGSSKFGENNKYGTFPSFAAAWNVINEPFMSANTLINNLKLRVGWGQTGNQEFPPGSSLRVVGIGRGVGTDLNQYPINYPNADVKWETNTVFNAGIDFAILDNRISGALDYYTRTSEDVLFQRNVTAPGPSQGRFWVNLPGSIVNSGFEMALTGAIIRSREMNWNLTVNAAFQTNELKDFNGTYETGILSGQGSTGTTVQRLASGQPVNAYYLRVFEGLDKATGNSTYKDNGDKLYYTNSPNPKVVLGLSTDFTWKNFSAVVNMNGAFGHYLFNETLMNVVPIGNLGTRNVARSLFGGEVQESGANPIAASTRYLEKGDYLKLANATLSYRLGSFFGIFNNTTVSLTGQNLFVITNYSGFDPEVNVDKNVNGVPSLGIEYIPYPPARTILLGVSFNL